MHSSSSIPFHTFPSSTQSPPSPQSTSFTLCPPPSHATDIWRKPSNPLTGAAIETFNAPIIYKKIPLKGFKRVRVGVEARWERLYDQGGLVLGMISNGKSNGEDKIEKWVKTGIEFFNDQAFVGTVGCEKWADWSLVKDGITDVGDGRKKVVIEMERHPTEGTLWVYIITTSSSGEETRLGVREVTWVFADENLTEGKEAWVGVYAATPIVEGRGDNEGLVVGFEGWELDVEL